MSRESCCRRCGATSGSRRQVGRNRPRRQLQQHCCHQPAAGHSANEQRSEHCEHCAAARVLGAAARGQRLDEMGRDVQERRLLHHALTTRGVLRPRSERRAAPRRRRSKHAAEHVGRGEKRRCGCPAGEKKPNSANTERGTGVQCRWPAAERQESSMPLACSRPA